ncbi:hypothetical protein WSM22_19640 [Cytophagales bacterium WSM2-2]|nr:hypothetical protein WSM22_19640 [Cytophagales bacterium WSM2-2]
MKKYLSYICLVAVIATTIGCSDFGSTDVNPNGSTVPLTSALLTNAIVAMGGAAGANGVGVTAGLYCQYFSQTLYTDASRYSLQDVAWSELNGNMYDLQNIININSDPKTAAYAALNGSNNNQIAIARILKAIRFSILTDRYGDMPYTEALTGKPNPKFDTQQSIYTDIFKELSEAVAQFDNKGAVKGDILFAGNNTRWQQLANSWRLILALRVSKADAATGKAQFTNVLSNLATNGGILVTSADDINLTFPGNAVEFNNPWYGLGGDQNVCTTIANWMNARGDDRRNAFGNVISAAQGLVGVPPGLKRDDALAYTNANPNHSLILNNTYRAVGSTLTILTAGDILLARAEAAVPTANGGLGWTNESYTALYASGISESWKHWGQNSAANLTAYMAQPLVDLASASSNIAEKIGTQRWISFYPNGPQGWSEWRRTGFPALSPAPEPLRGNSIPVRFIYPTTEYGLNLAGVNTAIAAQGADTPDTNVWWDK